MIDALGDRMKGYEACYDIRMTRRIPIILRVDGRSFHTWTRRNCTGRPFDGKFIEAMDHTARTLCSEISGAVAGFVQSDEISVLVRDDMTIETEPMFEKRVQKLSSVAASIATIAFNMRFNSYSATFDARVFAVPKADVGNYFLWRQMDATRNSVSSLAQSVFGAQRLHGVSCDDMRAMLSESGSPWEALPCRIRMGGMLVKRPVTVDGSDGPVERMKFRMLEDTPDLMSDKSWFSESSEVWK